MRDSKAIREGVGRDALPLMRECFRELVKILERHLGGPMDEHGLRELGLRLDLCAGEGILMSVCVPGTKLPPGVERL